MRLAMEEGLVNEGAFCVNVLHFLCCHIFTLLQFENIFLSVYNLHCISSRHQLPNITGFQPSIWCYGLLCFLLIFVISHKNSWSPKPYLSSWTWSSKLIFVFACIMHLLNILKFELKISHHASNMSTYRIDTVLNKSSRSVLRLPISFIERATHNNFHKLKCLFLYGSTACNH